MDGIFFTLRKYGLIIVSAVVSAVVFCVIFAYMSGGMAQNCAEINRIKATSVKEAVYTPAPAVGECFINLNGNLFVFDGSMRKMNADIYMETGAEYTDNALLHAGKLSVNGCAVSANLARKFNISLGQTIKTDKETSFTVEEILYPQRGIDDTYSHEGAVILGYDVELLNGVYAYNFVTFLENSDGVMNCTKIIVLSDLYFSALKGLSVNSAVTVLGTVAVIALCETTLFYRRNRDYKLMREDGVPALPVFGVIAGRTALKYLLPLAVVSVAFFAQSAVYGLAYFAPVLCCFAFSAVVTAVASALIFARYCSCRRIKT